MSRSAPSKGPEPAPTSHRPGLIPHPGSSRLRTASSRRESSCSVRARRSKRRQPPWSRATTGGSPSRSARAQAASVVQGAGKGGPTRTTAVGIGSTGVLPPPRNAVDSTTSAFSPNVSPEGRRQPPGAVAELVDRRGEERPEGNPGAGKGRIEHQSKRGFQRRESHLVDAEGAHQGVGLDPGDRLAACRPGCRTGALPGACLPRRGPRRHRRRVPPPRSARPGPGEGTRRQGARSRCHRSRRVRGHGPGRPGRRSGRLR